MHAARLITEKTVAPAVLPRAPHWRAEERAMDYQEQLKHPKWQRRRLERLEAAGWKCEKCFADSVTLHVHHKCYRRLRMAWEYSDTELEVLCEPCHSAEHGITRGDAPAQKPMTIDQIVLAILIEHPDTRDAISIDDLDSQSPEFRATVAVLDNYSVGNILTAAVWSSIDENGIGATVRSALSKVMSTGYRTLDANQARLELLNAVRAIRQRRSISRFTTLSALRERTIEEEEELVTLLREFSRRIREDDQ